jgi:hypothetical protein
VVSVILPSDLVNWHIQKQRKSLQLVRIQVVFSPSEQGQISRVDFRPFAKLGQGKPGRDIVLLEIPVNCIVSIHKVSFVWAKKTRPKPGISLFFYMNPFISPVFLP